MRENRFSCDHVIWTFEAGVEPAYSVEPGETFVVETMDALGGLVRRGMTEKPKIERANPATGPIAVRGLQPGQVLAIDILQIDLPPDGFLTFGGRPRFYDQVGGLIPFHPLIRLPIAPMIGTIGVIPAQGSYSNSTAGDYGGNMDTRDVAAGATLYLTAQLPGGLLAMGDVHATQGDGESSGQGVETGATITLRARVLHRGLSLRPYLVRKGELMVIVTAGTLDQAAKEAVEEMAQIIVRHSPLAYDEARMLLGQAGDLRISQIVNPLKTVRMALPLHLVPWSAPLEL